MPVSQIPKPALILGMLGTLPFMVAAFIDFEPRFHEGAIIFRNDNEVAIAYGLVILCFMSGTLWGFASHSNQARYYVASVLPALAAFFLASKHFFSFLGHSHNALWTLLVLFIALLPIDSAFKRAGLAPEWWMTLRIPITTVVSICLLVVGMR